MTRARASFATLVGGEHEKVVRFHTTDHDTEAAEALAREQGWLEAGDEANWPLLFVAFGLAALYRERDLEQLDHSDPAALAAERQRLRTVHMQLDGRLSPLRFAVFELARTKSNPRDTGVGAAHRQPGLAAAAGRRGPRVTVVGLGRRGARAAGPRLSSVDVVVECNAWPAVEYERMNGRRPRLVAIHAPGREGLPGDIGHVADSLDADGSAVTAILVSEASAHPGAVVPARVLGLVRASGADSDWLVVR